MNKIIKLSILSSILVIAGTPIHDLMDNRVKGKSFGGTNDDNQAAQDGLGILPLSSYSITTDIANELIIQQIFSDINNRETDLNTVNIRETILSGTAITPQETSILNQVGFQLSYQPGSLASCSLIKTNFPNSSSGEYLLSDGWTAKCDMTTGKEVYNNNLASCKEIKDRITDASTGNYYINTSTSTISVYCDMETDGGGWTRVDSSFATTLKGSLKNGYVYYANNIASDCSTTNKPISSQVRINGISFSQIRDDLKRSTITQCARFVSSNGVANLSGVWSGYLNSNGTYTEYGMCTWTAPYATQNTCCSTSISGNYYWRMIYNQDSSTSNIISFASTCSASTDNGLVEHQYFIK